MKARGETPSNALTTWANAESVRAAYTEPDPGDGYHAETAEWDVASAEWLTDA